MKCILAKVPSSALKSILFGAKTYFWPLWLIELLYICLDRLTLMLLSIIVGPLESSPEIMSAQFCWIGANTSAH